MDQSTDKATMEFDAMAPVSANAPGAIKSRWGDEYYAPRWVVSIPCGWEYEHTGVGTFYRAISRHKTKEAAVTAMENHNAKM